MSQDEAEPNLDDIDAAFASQRRPPGRPRSSETMTKPEVEFNPDGSYTQEYLTFMRASGQDKPDDVTWAEWMRPIQTTYRHETIAQLAAGGVAITKIAELTGYSPQRVGMLLQDHKIREMVDQKRQEMYGKPLSERLKSAIDPAMTIIERALADDGDPKALAGLKPNQRVDAAQWLIEKVSGKAPQTIEKKESYLVTLMSRIEKRMGDLPDSQQPGDVIEVKAGTPLPEKGQLPPPAQKDPYEQWVLDHIPQKDFSKKSLADHDDKRVTLKEPDGPNPHEMPLHPTPFEAGTFVGGD